VGHRAGIAPWELWVHARIGAWIPLSEGGASSMRDGLGFATSVKPFRSPVHLSGGLGPLVQDIEARYGSLDSPASVVAFLREEFARRPAAVLELLAWKAARSWYGTDSRRYDVWLLAGQIPFLAAAALGA